MKRKRCLKLLLPMILLLLMAQISVAQTNSTRTVTGVVNDDTGERLPGVVVSVKGTMVRALTSIDGAFTINVPANSDTLRFSFIGMLTADEVVGNKTVINVSLVSEVFKIDEVVVIGYGTITKSNLSTSVSSLKASSLDDRASAFNVMQGVAGKVAGVQAVTFSGKPGGGSELRIRGMGSVNADNNPIYVLDGVVGIDPQIINSANVESIDILKDAAATAIYGARGANGVVIITSKGGKEGKGTLTYNGKLGVSLLNRKVDVLDADGFMEIQKRAYAYSGKAMPHLENPNEKLFYYSKDAGGNYIHDDNGLLIASPKYDTDWQEAITQNAIIKDHTLSFTHGNSKTSTYSSISYQDFQGLVKNTYSNRLVGTVNVKADVNDWFNVQTVVNAGRQKRNDMEGGFGQGPIRNMLEMPPIVPVRYEDGTWGRKNDYDLGEVAENPILLLENQKKIWEEDFAIFNLVTTFKLTKNLTFTARGDMRTTNRRNINHAKAGLLDVSENNGGYADIGNEKYRYFTSEDYLSYSRKFFDNQLSSDFVLGASWYYNHMESSTSGSEDFFDDFFDYHNLGAGTTFHKPTSSMDQNTMNSFFFRMNHSFKSKYLLGFSFRADGASNFGTNNKYAYFPSASAAWRVSEEEFFTPVKDYVNNLKLRVSYGAVGNASIPNYRTISSYYNDSFILNKGLNPYVVLSNLGNKDLKWESTQQINVGLDVGLFNNRIELIIDYYNKITKDLLFEKQVSYVTGYPTTWTNLGKLRNQGIEITISSHNFNNKAFGWTTDLIFSANKLAVVDVNNETIDLGNNTIAKAGEEWGSYFVLNRLGTWGLAEVEQAARYGKKPGDLKFEDVDNDGNINDNDRKIMGNGLPKGNITMVNTLRYKNLSLMFDLSSSYGFKVMGIGVTMMENRQLYGNSVSSVLNAWTPENQNSMIAAVRLPSEANFGQNEKDTRMLYKGDFLRIRNISLMYSLGSKMLTKMKLIKGIDLGLSVENPYIFTNYPGFDPEVAAFSTDKGQSIDFYSYPRPTTVSGNIKITF